MKRRKMTWVLWIFFSVIILLAVIALYFQERISEKVGHLVLKTLQDSLGPDIQIESIKFDLIPTTITLEKVIFPKQKTAYEMRESDWSSDVCSSDLCSSACLSVTPPPPCAPLLHGHYAASSLLWTL